MLSFRSSESLTKFISNSTAIRRNSRSFIISSKTIPFASRILTRGRTFSVLRKPIHFGYRKVIRTKVDFKKRHEIETSHTILFCFVIAFLFVFHSLLLMLLEVKTKLFRKSIYHFLSSTARPYDFPSFRKSRESNF